MKSEVLSTDQLKFGFEKITQCLLDVLPDKGNALIINGMFIWAVPSTNAQYPKTYSFVNHDLSKPDVIKAFSDFWEIQELYGLDGAIDYIEAVYGE